MRLQKVLVILLGDSFIQSALAILRSERHLSGQLGLPCPVRSSVHECLRQSLRQRESRQAYLVANFALRWRGSLKDAAWLAHEGRAARLRDQARVPAGSRKVWQLNEGAISVSQAPGLLKPGQLWISWIPGPLSVLQAVVLIDARKVRHGWLNLEMLTDSADERALVALVGYCHSVNCTLWAKERWRHLCKRR